MKNIIKIYLKVDTFVQGLLMLSIAASCLVDSITSTNILILGLFLTMILGIWQVVSAILSSALMRSIKPRGIYLLSVSGFFASLYFLESYFEGTHIVSAYAWFVPIAIMCVLAIYSFTITIRDMVVANSDYIHHKK